MKVEQNIRGIPDKPGVTFDLWQAGAKKNPQGTDSLRMNCRTLVQKLLGCVFEQLVDPSDHVFGIFEEAGSHAGVIEDLGDDHLSIFGAVDVAGGEIFDERVARVDLQGDAFFG